MYSRSLENEPRDTFLPELIPTYVVKSDNNLYTFYMTIIISNYDISDRSCDNLLVSSFFTFMINYIMIFELNSALNGAKDSEKHEQVLQNRENVNFSIEKNQLPI